jgi:hypothetical membrane protein
VSIPRPVDRALAYSGAAGVVVAFGSILLTTALEPWFAWPTNALSHLGDPDRWGLYWLFNGGLAVAGALGSLFVLRVALAARSRAHRLAAAVLLAATVDLALVGVFEVGHPLHGPVSVAFFVALTYGLFLYGTADALDGRPRRGLAFVWLGIAHVTGWALWATVVPWTGVAVPESAGAAALGAWTVAVTRDLTG